MLMIDDSAWWFPAARTTPRLEMDPVVPQFLWLLVIGACLRLLWIRLRKLTVGLLPPCKFFELDHAVWCSHLSFPLSHYVLLSQSPCIGCPSCRWQQLGRWFRNVGGKQDPSLTMKQAVLVRCLNLYPLIYILHPTWCRFIVNLDLCTSEPLMHN